MTPEQELMIRRLRAMELNTCNEAADLIEQMAQAKPSRSERLREAGFTPRDKRIACDECGQLVSQQFLPIHKCEQRGGPVAWLHDVVQDDGEPDQALSFSPDNFPLEGVGGFRSVKRRPLYLAPPARRVPLSEEQIMNLVRDDCGVMRWPSTVLDIARAVEQVHGIRSEK